MTGLVERIEHAAVEAGLDLVGFTSAEPFPAVRRTMHDRKASGLSGRLGFTYRDPDLATDPRSSFPAARSLVVGAVSYVPRAGSPGDPDGRTVRVARFAMDDHYRPLRDGLSAIAGVLESDGYFTEILVDDSRLVDRAAAVRAGIGWWGKSTMVISPRFGPWLLVGSIATDAEIPSRTPMRRDCGTCDACMPACPTGALIAPGVLDATRCLAYWAQTAGIVPPELREPWGDRIYGCDNCLEACPPGHAVLRSAARGSRMELAEVLIADDDTLLQRAGHWFIPRRDPDFLRRNAIIAAGNTGREEHRDLLEAYVHHRRSMLRVHAAWALGRFGAAGRAALSRRRPVEHDPEVLEEIDGALAAL